tara:strand:- start:912 stop:1904 length:993 start_codon:yes stop_codon:yes gene_type:complete
MPVYADNPSNRKLNRVGLEKGSAPAPMSPRRQAGGARAGKKKVPQGPQPKPGGASKPEVEVVGDTKFFSKDAPGTTKFQKNKSYGVSKFQAKGDIFQLEKSESSGVLPPMQLLKKREQSLKSQIAKYKKGFSSTASVSQGKKHYYTAPADPDAHWSGGGQKSYYTMVNLEEKLDAIKKMIAKVKSDAGTKIDLLNVEDIKLPGQKLTMTMKGPTPIKMSVKPNINKVKITKPIPKEVHTLKQKGPAPIKMSVKHAVNLKSLKSVNEVIESNPTIKRIRKDIKITKGKIKKYVDAGDPKYDKRLKKYQKQLKDEEEQLASYRKQLHPNFGK